LLYNDKFFGGNLGESGDVCSATEYICFEYTNERV